MESTNIIAAGQSLKRIRKELGLKQQEIVGEEITRNLISMIENGKSPLNYRIAQLAVDNINRIAEERNLGVYFVPEDIIYPKRMEAKGQADKYIQELKNHIENKDYNLDENYMKEIIEFLNQWKIYDKKVEIYELLGDISYYNKKAECEYVYLNRALENYYILPIKKDIHLLVRKLIASCIANERYEEAVKLSELDILENNAVSDKFKATIYYNKAVAYKRLEEYDKSLELFDYIERNFKDVNEQVNRYSLLVKGICYSQKGKKDKAINTYKKVIEKYGKNNEDSCLAYSNIISLLRKLDCTEEVIEYKDKIMKILSYYEREDNRYLVEIYLSLGQVNEYLNKLGLAEYYYISAISKAVDRKDNERSVQIMLSLLDLYSKTNQMEKIFLSNNIFKLGFENHQISNEMRLVLNLVWLNMKYERKKEAKNIVNNILEGGLCNDN